MKNESGGKGTENHEDPFYCFLKILNVGSISSRNHEMEFGHMGSIVFQKHETGFPKLCIFETLKPRNEETRKLRNSEKLIPYPSTYRLPPLHHRLPSVDFGNHTDSNGVGMREISLGFVQLLRLDNVCYCSDRYQVVGRGFITAARAVGACGAQPEGGVPGDHPFLNESHSFDQTKPTLFSFDATVIIPPEIKTNIFLRGKTSTVDFRGYHDLSAYMKTITMELFLTGIYRGAFLL